jgi:hypothetical protein
MHAMIAYRLLFIVVGFKASLASAACQSALSPGGDDEGAPFVLDETPVTKVIRHEMDEKVGCTHWNERRTPRAPRDRKL